MRRPAGRREVVVRAAHTCSGACGGAALFETGCDHVTSFSPWTANGNSFFPVDPFLEHLPNLYILSFCWNQLPYKHGSCVSLRWPCPMASGNWPMVDAWRKTLLIRAPVYGLSMGLGFLTDWWPQITGLLMGWRGPEAPRLFPQTSVMPSCEEVQAILRDRPHGGDRDAPSELHQTELQERPRQQFTEQTTTQLTHRIVGSNKWLLF